MQTSQSQQSSDHCPRETGGQLRLAIYDVFEQLQQEHVYYVELRFAPLLHTTKGLSAEEVVAAVDAAAASASQITGVEARIILCTLRHFTPEQSCQQQGSSSVSKEHAYWRSILQATKRVIRLNLMVQLSSLPLNMAFHIQRTRGIGRSGERMGNITPVRDFSPWARRT